MRTVGTERRRAKRSSALAHSKRVENEVAKYFFGPDARRDWKEEWDVLGEANGVWYVMEVKAERINTVGDAVRRLREALQQAGGYRQAVALAVDTWPTDVVPVGVLWPKGSRTRLVAVERPDTLGVMEIYTWRDFRKLMWRGEPPWVEGSEPQ